MPQPPEAAGAPGHERDQIGTAGGAQCLDRGMGGAADADRVEVVAEPGAFGVGALPRCPPR